MAIKSVILTTGFAVLAQAFHQPGAQTYGALTRPDGSHPVTQGQSYSVTWQQPSGAPAGQTVSLVLCNGPGANCVIQSSAIVENVPASQNSYTWSVPCSLPVGQANSATGYGMLIIVDQTGEFQYSTQFSVEAGSSCGSSGSTTSSSSGGSTTSSSSSTTSQSSMPQPTTSSMNSWNSTTTAGASSTTWSTYTKSSATTATAQQTSATGTSTAPGSTFTGGAIQTAVNVAGALGAVGLALFAM